MNNLKFYSQSIKIASLATVLCLSVATGCDRPSTVADKNSPTTQTDVKDAELESKEFKDNAADNPAGEQKQVADNDTAKTETKQSKPAADDSGQKALTFEYRVLHWNVESGGNDPAVVSAQLVELIEQGSYNVIGLSEVDKPEAYEEAVSAKWPNRYQFIRGLTGVNPDREDDHLWFAIDRELFDVTEQLEMKEISGFVFDDGHHRVPLYVRVVDKNNKQEVVFIMNHFARGDKEFRQAQARTLREWARTKSEPIVAIGDYNLDYVFATKKGNPAFDEFMKDNVWNWVRPEPLIDTNWSDRDGDGIDNYIDSLLDFSFVAGRAKTWENSSRVIVRENDFPDDDKTSDHRPVELILKNQ